MKSLRKLLVSTRHKLTGYSPERQRRIEETLLSIQSETYKITENAKKIVDYSTIGILPISNNEVAVKLFNDLVIYMDPRDIAVVPHIALERIWEKEITWAWLTIMDTYFPKTILDVGANFGYFGLLSAQRAKVYDGKVIMYEANPNLPYYINKSLSVNWLNENAKVANVGVSDKPGSGYLSLLENYIGSSSMHSLKKLDSYAGHKMGVKLQERIKVEMVTIDEHCKNNDISSVELVKMDIEGFEEKAYNGMRTIVKNSPEIKLFVEFTKDGYEDPEGFYNTMKRDMPFVYTINSLGELVLVKDNSYGTVAGGNKDWVMLVFSKKSLTEKIKEVSYR